MNPSQETTSTVAEDTRPWYKLLTKYHWFVLIVCTMGWAFDTFDQQLFNIARQPAVQSLLQSPTKDAVSFYAGLSTSLMLIGWATGGIIFGILGDRWGRARTMVLTILGYSLFTGLSAFSVTIWDFLAYRFIAGLGIGGQFGLGAALVAETLPDRARPRALGMLQAFSAFGNMAAGLIGLVLAQMLLAGAIDVKPWRLMFGVGILPAFLAVLVMMRLQEPERWKQSVGTQEGDGKKQKAGSIAELFGDPRWRKNVLVGITIAAAGVIGLWGIGFFSIDLNQSIFRERFREEYRAQGEADEDLKLVALVYREPKALEELKAAEISPKHLLGEDRHDQDAALLLAAALTLDESGKPVTVDAALDLLDAPVTGADETPLDVFAPKREPQSQEDRARREKLLAEQQGDLGTVAAHVERIRKRNKDMDGRTAVWGSITSLLFNIGAFFGIYAFSIVTTRLGRRPTFAIFFLAALVSTVIAFMFMNDPIDVYWMVPLMGFCQLSVFGGYAIYFPELFPTRLRSTGTSFCYNIGRYVSAAGPALLGTLSGFVFAGTEEPMRWAGVTMCAFFLLGVLVLPLAPETKDQPLPE